MVLAESPRSLSLGRIREDSEDPLGSRTRVARVLGSVDGADPFLLPVPPRGRASDLPFQGLPRSKTPAVVLVDLREALRHVRLRGLELHERSPEPLVDPPGQGTEIRGDLLE